MMVSTSRSGFVRASRFALTLGTLGSMMVPFGVPFAPVSVAMAAQGPASVADLAEGLLDSVVNISTSQTVKGDGEDESAVQPPQVPEGSPFQEFFDDFFGKKGKKDGDAQSRKVQSLGSGFVIDAEKGFIVTNNHVIADADEIEVNFNDGSKVKAELFGKDLKTDIAVLKVDPKAHKLKAVAFGNSEMTRIGDWVMAIGNPFGLGGTVTVGIISARKRDINSGPYDSFLQTDAAINRGNSGGPLFDMDGKVIGINTAIISPSGGSIGIGFAIPAEMAVGVIDQLKEFGETRRGWLGIRIQPLTDDVADSLGLKDSKGALIAGLIEGANVDSKALEAGDVVIRFDGKPVDTARDLPRLVAESQVGKDVAIVVIRKGEEKSVNVKLGRLVETDKDQAIDEGEDEDEDQVPLPEDSKPSTKDEAGKGDANKNDAAKDKNEQNKSEKDKVSSVSVLGMRLGKLDEAARGTFGIAADVQGVLITGIIPQSVAAEKRVERGEVIVDIGQEVVKTPEDVKKRIDALRREGRKNALLMLAARSGELRFVTMRLD